MPLLGAGGFERLATLAFGRGCSFVPNNEELGDEENGSIEEKPWKINETELL